MGYLGIVRFETDTEDRQLLALVHQLRMCPWDCLRPNLQAARKCIKTYETAVWAFVYREPVFEGISTPDTKLKIDDWCIDK